MSEVEILSKEICELWYRAFSEKNSNEKSGDLQVGDAYLNPNKTGELLLFLGHPHEVATKTLADLKLAMRKVDETSGFPTEGLLPDSVDDTNQYKWSFNVANNPASAGVLKLALEKVIEINANREKWNAMEADRLNTTNPTDKATVLGIDTDAEQHKSRNI